MPHPFEFLSNSLTSPAWYSFLTSLLFYFKRFEPTGFSPVLLILSAKKFYHVLYLFSKHQWFQSFVCIYDLFLPPSLPHSLSPLLPSSLLPFRPPFSLFLRIYLQSRIIDYSPYTSQNLFRKILNTLSISYRKWHFRKLENYTTISKFGEAPPRNEIWIGRKLRNYCY